MVDRRSARSCAGGTGGLTAGTRKHLHTTEDKDISINTFILDIYREHVYMRAVQKGHLSFMLDI